MEFHFNDIKNHVLLNKLCIEEAERNYNSKNNNQTYIDKLYNSYQGKAAELYLVENYNMQFLTYDNYDSLNKHKYYNELKHNILYHDLIKDNKIIEVKALTSINIDYKINKILHNIQERTWNYSDYLLVFIFDNWQYKLYKKIKIKDKNE